MNEMIERVAKAVRKADETPDTLDCTSEDDVYRAIAGAAVEAMREPTPAMIEAIEHVLGR
jgi:hypothetical protein